MSLVDVLAEHLERAIRRIDRLEIDLARLERGTATPSCTAPEPVLALGAVPDFRERIVTPERIAIPAVGDLRRAS